MFDVLTPDEVKGLKQATSGINANLLRGFNLGALKLRTRER